MCEKEFDSKIRRSQCHRKAKERRGVASKSSIVFWICPLLLLFFLNVFNSVLGHNYGWHEVLCQMLGLGIKFTSVII